MLKALQRMAAGQIDNAQMAELQELVTTLTASLQEKTKEIAALATQLAEKEATLTELNSKLEQYAQIAQAAEAEAEAQKELAVKQALDIKRSKLADVIGAQNPTLEATFEALCGLEDAAYETVLAGFKVQQAQEAKGDMFSEKGISGEADLSKQSAGETREMRILKQKYNKSI